MALVVSESLEPWLGASSVSWLNIEKPLWIPGGLTGDGGTELIEYGICTISLLSIGDLGSVGVMLVGVMLIGEGDEMSSYCGSSVLEMVADGEVVAGGGVVVGEDEGGGGGGDEAGRCSFFRRCSCTTASFNDLFVLVVRAGDSRAGSFGIL